MCSINWFPKFGERYYFIYAGRDTLFSVGYDIYDFTTDFALIRMKENNFFETYEKANEAALKLKEVLLKIKNDTIEA